MAVHSSSTTAPGSRRGFLRGLAALPIATVAPAVATASDPVLTWVQQEQPLYDWYNEGGDDQELDRRAEVYAEHERRTYETPPTTLAGLAALLDLWVRREVTDAKYAPERYIIMLAGYARDLSRLAAGAPS